jgi:hypothetical protein
VNSSVSVLLISFINSKITFLFVLSLNPKISSNSKTETVPSEWISKELNAIFKFSSVKRLFKLTVACKNSGKPI